jgi:hypothetical protein
MRNIETIQRYTTCVTGFRALPHGDGSPPVWMAKHRSPLILLTHGTCYPSFKDVNKGPHRLTATGATGPRHDEATHRALAAAATAPATGGDSRLRAYARVDTPRSSCSITLVIQGTQHRCEIEGSSGGCAYGRSLHRIAQAEAALQLSNRARLRSEVRSPPESSAAAHADNELSPAAPSARCSASSAPSGLMDMRPGDGPKRPSRLQSIGFRYVLNGMPDGRICTESGSNLRLLRSSRRVMAAIGARFGRM